MVVALEIVGWLLLVLAVLGILLNWSLVRRDPDHRHHAATRQVVLACMIGAGTLLAVVYSLAALDVADTLMESGRRGGPLWIPVGLFAFLALAAGRGWRKGRS